MFEIQSDTEASNGWQTLPDVVLEQIFNLLSIKEKHISSQVCSNWFRIFYSSRVWSLFVLDDMTLTKRKYNYYLGYQRILDHYRTQVWHYKNGITCVEIYICCLVFGIACVRNVLMRDTPRLCTMASDFILN